MHKYATYIIVGAVVLVAGYLVWGRGEKRENDVSENVALHGGLVRVDGSSTVFPITEAVAEEFKGVQPETNVTVGISGTGGGFEKFCAGETAVSNASRPIKDVEIEACAANGIEFIELPVAFDGIAVVVHSDNTWVNSLTVADLKKIWEPQAQGSVMKWSDVRPEWPDKELHLFGPGVDSGTFDYFTDAIVGEEGSSRGDFTASEDDNVLVQGVATDQQALGFFGVAYYEENRDKLKVVPIDDGDDTNGTQAVLPGYEAVLAGDYQPLSRPLLLYVSLQAAQRPEVESFIEFYLTEGGMLARDVGYIALAEEAYGRALEKFQQRKTGTAFMESGSQVGVTIDDLLR